MKYNNNSPRILKLSVSEYSNESSSDLVLFPKYGNGIPVLGNAGFNRQKSVEIVRLKNQLKEVLENQNKKLAEIKAENSRFISVIAHDMRSPFNAIIGVLEIMKDNLKDYRREEFEEYVNIACDSADNTLKLLDSLLNWAYSQSKEATFCPVKINMRELLDEEISSAVISADLKKIIIRSDIRSNLSAVADSQMIRSVMRNLLSNSVKFTNTGGEITVCASESNGLIEISVRDNGIGMPSASLQRLFKTDSFQSANGTNNERGSGLGLILCKEFVERNGGEIWIESEPGKGCVSTFTLPATE